MDQVFALKCTVAGSNPSMRPVCYREVSSSPLKYARNFKFDPFLQFFSFDSLGAVPKNLGKVIRGVRLSVGPICRGTTVCETRVLVYFRGTQFWKPFDERFEIRKFLPSQYPKQFPSHVILLMSKHNHIFRYVPTPNLNI